VISVSLYLLSETYLTLKRIQRYIIINYVSLHVNYPAFLSNFNETLISRHISEKKYTQVSNFMKISPEGAELLHLDTQKDINDKVNARLLQFYEGA
jgi:hypothetical protein